MTTNAADSVLCFVKDSWAYFTTQSLDKQWGDDWNDAPYEYNAGEPYGPHSPDENWRIIKIAWDGPFNTPRDSEENSNWSVEQINNKEVPWLITWSWRKYQVIIHAGTTLSEFCKLIHQAGGFVYMEPSIAFELREFND